MRIQNIFVKTSLLGLILLLFVGCANRQTGTSNQSLNEPSPAVTHAEIVIPTPTLSTQPSIPATEANADVLYVSASQDLDRSWTFSVTIYHPDRGWEDYADGWDLVLPNGDVIKPDPKASFTRPLLHPHIDEQPFTRSQSGIIIPPDTPWLIVRSHDFVDGFGGREVKVDFAVGNGKDFDVTAQP